MIISVLENNISDLKKTEIAASKSVLLANLELRLIQVNYSLDSVNAIRFIKDFKA